VSVETQLLARRRDCRDFPIPTISICPDPFCAASQQIVVGSSAQCHARRPSWLIDGRNRHAPGGGSPSQAHGLLIRVDSNTVSFGKIVRLHESRAVQNQSISQIAGAMLSPLGIQFKYGANGPPSMAEKTFDRVSPERWRNSLCGCPRGLRACATCS